MKELGYGRGYRYAFDSEDHYVPQEYLPERLRGTTFYTPSEFGFEKRIGERLAWWAERRREAEAKEGRDEERGAEGSRSTNEEVG